MNEKYGKIYARLVEQRKEVEQQLLNVGLVYGEDYFCEGIYLQGSQNYRAHHENSDIDSKYVVIPTVKSLLRGTNFTRDLSVSKNEKVSVKPFIGYVDLFFKGNVNNLEMLFTNYSVGCTDSFTIIPHIGYYHGEDIVKATKKTVSNAIIGMMLQKQKSLHKGTATTKCYVEELGYDPKDAQHILRLGMMYVSLFEENKSFAESLVVPSDFKDVVKEVIYTKNPEMDSICEAAILLVKDLERWNAPQNDDEQIKYLRETIAEEYEYEYNDYLVDKYKG